MKKHFALFLLAGLVAFATSASICFEKDTVKTSAGNLIITFIGHGTLMMQFDKTTIHVDPFGRLTDYSALPKADIVLITHQHGDHLDAGALEKVHTNKTTVLLTQACAESFGGGTVMKNGDTQKIQGVTIEAVPAYNLVHSREGEGCITPKEKVTATFSPSVERESISPGTRRTLLK